jgi:arylsulfatase A-like enzyme
VAAPVERGAHPNVLFIAVDDLNDWIGVLAGQPGFRTPNIDRLSRRGVLFSRAYCAAPACNPSRASLMTGKRPSTSGVYHNDQPWRPVMKDVVTLPQHFMANGYEVYGGGKIYHDVYNDLASWQSFFKRTKDPLPEGRPLNGIARTAHFDWGPLNVADAEMSDYKTTSWAIDYLQKPHARPFFLAVGLFRPHLPWFVPKAYFDQQPLAKIRVPMTNRDDLDDVPPAGRRMAKPDGDHRKVVSSQNWERAVQGYQASITFADQQIGRLLDTLDRTPYGKDTIIVFWGDHGWHLGQKQHWRKFALWEEATRVPLVISAPRYVEHAGLTTGRTANLLDLYPTLIELCSLSPREGLEGKSLVPLLSDPGVEWNRPVVTTHGRNNHAVRSERWRYIHYEDGSEELYDHDQDPLEWKNLAGSAEFTSVKEELKRWLPTTNAPDAPHEKGGDGEDG